MYENCIVFRCPGLFHGEVIVALGEANRSLIFTMLAKSPSYEYASDVFHELVDDSFPQYIRLPSTPPLAPLSY